MRTETLLTENEVNRGAAYWLMGMGAESIQFGRRGPDISCTIEICQLLVEGKGAKPCPESKNAKRSFFDELQIKKHYGDLLVQCATRRNQYPNAIVCLALPDHLHVRNILMPIVEQFESLQIPHIWVSRDTVEVSESDVDIIWAAIYEPVEQVLLNQTL
jgi:hypothetical protein